MGDRLGTQPRDVRDRLETRVEGAPTQDNRVGQYSIVCLYNEDERLYGEKRL